MGQFQKLLVTNDEKSKKTKQIQETIDAGVVPRLLELLQNDAAVVEVKVAAAWTLDYLIRGTSEQARAVIDDHGAVPLLIRTIQSTDNAITLRTPATWMLGRIAGNSLKDRDMVLQAGAAPLLLKMLQQKPSAQDSELRRAASWTCGQFFAGKTLPDFEIVKKAVPVMVLLLRRQNEHNDVVINASWVLSNLTKDPKNIHPVIEGGACPELVKLIDTTSGDNKVQKSWNALITLGFIAAGTAEQKQAVIETGACKRLFEVLENRKSKNCLQNALHAVAIIAEGTVSQKQAIIDCDNALTTLRTFFDSPDDQLRQNAYTAITQITRGGSVDQIQAVIDAGIVSAIFEDELLTDDEGDVETAFFDTMARAAGAPRCPPHAREARLLTGCRLCRQPDGDLRQRRGGDAARGRRSGQGQPLGPYAHLAPR